MEKWRGKVAVVTGANSGNGNAIFRCLLEAEMIGVGIDLQTDKIEEMKKEFGGRVFALVSDVCDYVSLKRAFQWIEKTLGGVDVLVNNAGILKPGNILDDGETALRGFEKTIDINFAGVVRCIRLAFNSMKNKEFAHIININSVVGHYVPSAVGTNVYTGTKHAGVATTEQLRQELIRAKNDKIRITSISPGVVNTNLFNTFADEAAEKILSPGYLSPRDIGNAIVYVLSMPQSVTIAELTIRATGSVL